MLLPVSAFAPTISLFRAAIPRKMRGDWVRGARSHELRRAVCRAEGRRSQPGGGGTLLRDAARPARRRRHQGRAHRRGRLEPHARQTLRRPHRLFDPDQPRQALDRARSQVGRGQGRAVAADRRRRRAARGLPARRARPAGLRLRGGCQARAAHPLPLRVGLRPDRPARRPAGDGPGAAGLHRPHDGQQGRGRHPASRAVRGDRHVDGALRLPGPLRRPLCAARPAPRPAYRGEPARGGQRHTGDPDDDGLPRGRARQALHAERRIQDRRRLAAIPGRAPAAVAEHLRGSGDAAARRRSALRRRRGAHAQRGGADGHRAAGDRPEAHRLLVRAARQSRHHARAPQQLPRVPAHSLRRRRST